MNNLKKSLLISGAVVVVGLGGLGLARLAVQASSPPPNNLGVREGKLTACPPTPNCVSSQADDPEHYIDSIPYTTSTAEAKATLLKVLGQTPRLTVVADLPDYIYAETRSRAFGFVDDNEFSFDEAAGVIHVRAAARLGRSDLGANRRRIEAIRQAFEAAARP